MSQQSPFTPSNIAGLTLRNTTIRSGCYEGLCRDGRVTPELLEHHREVAAGGIAMTTVAYGAVAQQGRTFVDQIIVGEKSREGLTQLADAVHNEESAVSIQLTHGGYFADPKAIGETPWGASKKYNSYRMTACRPMTEEDIREVIENFADAAVTVKECGFDAVEIHAGHGYLLSQFLSPFTNMRDDAWGGTQEKRNKFPSEIIKAVRKAVGDDFPILVKLNLTDGFKGGLLLDDALLAARAFEAAGASALIPSCGFTSRTPFMMLRGDVPVKEMAKNIPGLFMRAFLRLFGALVVKRYEYTPLFLFEESSRMKDTVAIPVVYVGGVLSIDDIQKALDSGFSFVQIGRATIRDPQIINKMERGEVTTSECDACNRCVAAMDAGGVYCVTVAQAQ